MCPAGKEKMMLQRKGNKTWTEVLKKVGGAGIQSLGEGLAFNGSRENRVYLQM